MIDTCGFLAALERSQTLRRQPSPPSVWAKLFRLSVRLHENARKEPQLKEFSWRRLRKLFLFAAAPLLGIVSPLLVIPSVTSQFGAAGWSAIAIGMSSGAAGAVLVELGWGLTGPQQVAVLARRDRGHIYLLSSLTKVAVFILVAPLVYITAEHLSPAYSVESGLMGVATAAIGLSPAWFFIGTSEPSRVLFTDSIPKVIAAVISALSLFGGAPLLVYPALFILSALISPALGASMAHIGAHSRVGISANSAFAAVKRQAVALLGRVASSMYLSLPTVLLAVISPTAVASFSAADRLQRMLLATLVVFPNSLQNWIGSSPDLSVRQHRVRLSIAANSALGATAGLAFAAAGPTLANLVFTGAVPVGWPLSACCGFIIFLTCTSRAVGGLGLVAYKRVGWVTSSAVAGAVVGLALIFWLGHLWGAVGALGAMVAAELVVVVIQVFGLRSRKDAT
jgi:hypothetical protein